MRSFYDNIGESGKIEKDVALVRSVPGAYGFIDKNGKEAVPLIYTLDEAKEKVKSIVHW
ncbi:MAG: hypothetical protein RBR28_12420 [Lentimicrobium sp.]|nr:hypothetical protein [Lentimicrobium sp.]